ncbi:MAG: hypothetical protein KDC92_06260 [Bacteroidetes bacterium]|nr:hypothetical protein [Bacteroidota bacterium]
MKGLLLGLLVCWFAFSTNAQDAESADDSKKNQALYEIPFQLYGEKIFIDVYIDDTTKLNAVFDNGIPAYIHSGTAQKHGLQYSGTADIQGTSGGGSRYKIKNLPVRMGNYSDTFEQVVSQIAPSYLNKRVDMVFGYELITLFTVQIDYTESIIKLYESRGFEAPAGYDSIPVKQWLNYPIIESDFTFSEERVIPLKMELNVGLEVGFNIDEYITRKHNLQKTHKNNGRIMLVGPDGTGVYGQIIRINGVTIGPYQINRAKGGAFDQQVGTRNSEKIHGQIGQPILKLYNIIFSYRTNQVWMIEKPEPE